MPDDLFHPYHVVPAAEFVTAFMKSADLCKTEMPVELFAVPGKVFILNDRIADAGIQIENAGFLQFSLKGFIQYAPVSPAVRVVIQIN